jgi:hypothetical protein
MDWSLVPLGAQKAELDPAGKRLLLDGRFIPFREGGKPEKRETAGSLVVVRLSDLKLLWESGGTLP